MGWGVNLNLHMLNNHYDKCGEYEVVGKQGESRDFILNVSTQGLQVADS